MNLQTVILAVWDVIIELSKRKPLSQLPFEINRLLISTLTKRTATYFTLAGFDMHVLLEMSFPALENEAFRCNRC